MAELFLGKPVSDRIMQQVAEVSASLAQKPKLATLRVGERDDDIAYERSLASRCGQVSLLFQAEMLPADAPRERIAERIYALETDDSVDGILLFQPLPKGLSDSISDIRNAIPRRKDVDAITDAALADLFLGKRGAFAPCTAEACLETLRYYKIPLSGAEVVIVGRSFVVGRPLAAMLLGENATVTVCHTKTKDLENVCRRADILIAAAGTPRLIGTSHVRSGQIVLDVGIHSLPDGGMCGDVDADAVSPVVRALTPVPRGIGSITTAVLLKHVCAAAVAQ